MSEGNGNGHSSRVTNRELDAKLELVRQEQRTEIEKVRSENNAAHWKTRLAIVIVSIPGALKSTPAVLGLLGIYHGWIPWN